MYCVIPIDNPYVLNETPPTFLPEGGGEIQPPAIGSDKLCHYCTPARPLALADHSSFAAKQVETYPSPHWGLLASARILRDINTMSHGMNA